MLERLKRPVRFYTSYSRLILLKLLPQLHELVLLGFTHLKSVEVRQLLGLVLYGCFVSLRILDSFPLDSTNTKILAWMLNIK